MPSLNRVYLIGNLTKDPEVKYLPDGAAVADLRLAVNEKFRRRTTGEEVEQTCYVDVVVWRKQAESCGRYLSKGSPIFVEGRLQLDEWEAQDKSKRSRLRVVALRVQFLGSTRGQGQELSDTAPGAQPTDAQPRAADSVGGDAGDESPAGSGDNLGDDDNLPF